MPAALIRCGVVGDPVAHSLSPVLHAAAYDALGLAGRYTAHRVPAGGLAGFVDELLGSGEGWRGLSVTMPLKREAHALAERRGSLDDAAARAGGVNTLVLDPGSGGVVGPVHGHNTDVPGAVAALAERDVLPRRVAVLGGGATAASLALAAADLGAEVVRFCVREPGRAEEAAAAVRAHPAAPRVEIDLLEPSTVTGDLVVSTVPAAAQSEELVAACVVAAGASGAVFEALYDPWPTPLARAAEATGAVLVSGFDLLVHQAALQLALFTGHAAPLGAMRDAGLAALATRA
ncbi:shikimate dehydrogenase [Nocardioides sp. CFH 31398]|uniref:shikimate dehydrogenase family protein n=1 Tax=Nocardioides sp. CFH 31398 TaxID=2919579 RepID=UPI001F068D5B|nr:shikimate dehydrogenase [Nocardioides sp. CFH 31398]MCH1867399.1 shikimate dehydrogenase [Nocardioides sp. CFH 31398]MCH1868604.1 shikimate dehydrogenase [Nocardioides sp. CFH 31398]